MSDIVDTLLDWSEYDEGKINDAREKAANEIKRLRAENERLRAALEPFAKSANAFDQLKHFKPEECFVYGGQSRPDGNVGAITVGDLRRASAALEGKP